MKRSPAERKRKSKATAQPPAEPFPPNAKPDEMTGTYGQYARVPPSIQYPYPPNFPQMPYNQMYPPGYPAGYPQASSAQQLPYQPGQPAYQQQTAQYRPNQLAPPPVDYPRTGSPQRNYNQAHSPMMRAASPQSRPSYPQPANYPYSQTQFRPQPGQTPPRWGHPYPQAEGQTPQTSYQYQQHAPGQPQYPQGMYPPGAWPPGQPGYPGHPSYPMRSMPGAAPPGYPGYPQPQQQAPPQQQPQPGPAQPPPAEFSAPASVQPPQTGPPSQGEQSSRSTPVPPPAAPTSRPPSQAHYQPPSTPDQRPVEEQRPSSRQPPRVGHTPTPSSSAASMPGPAQPPPQMAMSHATPAQNYFPPGYRPMPPPGQPKYPGYPEQPGYAQNLPPTMYPGQQQQFPPGMPWPPTSQQSTPQRFLNPQPHPMPGKPQQQPPPQEFRRPQPPPTGIPPSSSAQQQQFYPQQSQPSPGTVQRQRVPQPQAPPPPQPQPQTYMVPGPGRPVPPQQHAQPHHLQYPPNSLEATATSIALRRKRPRQYAREMVMATPKRLTMALRSGQELDTIWAINTLTVILYDDTAQPLSLSSEPQLLIMCLEHLKALLAVLYPGEMSLKDNMGKMEKVREFEEKFETDLVKPADNKLGRKNQKVAVEKNSKKSLVLQRLTREWMSDVKEENETAEVQTSTKPVTGLCHRIYRSLITKLNAKNGLQRLKFSKFDADFKQENNIDANEEKRDEEDEDILIYRKPKEWEVWDRHQNPDVSMIPRNVPILERDQNLEELTDRALAFSNIIRGFSFFPGNEKFLVNNLELLDLIGRLLLLKVGVDEQQLLVKHPKIKVKTEEEDEKVKLEKDMQKYVAPERDSNEKLLMEIANQLRDDAFTILAHVSVQLDLYNVDPEISYRIFDALLHWGVTTNIQAKDPFYPSVISPRSYVFEIICKMSLLETNIDLLLATGAWPRTEEFIRVVSNSITMAEELPNREFAIVILTAMCQASEPACIVSALETQVVQNLISFLEAAEFNINQIAGNEGVHSLRDNPERIGTSFGMLRRAAQILASFAQYEICRPLFVKHQSRLLSFTVSSYMDSRVAGIVAGILYEIQHISPELLNCAEVSIQEREQMAEHFPSYKWKVSDDAEDPPEPFLKVTLPPPIDPFHVEVQKGLTSRTTTPKSGSISPSRVNGLIEVNGNSKRKRTRHEDGTEMSALERELLNDSDAESGPEDCEDEVSQSASEANSFISSETTLKTASEAVKEKLRNNIMKHGEHQNGHDEEPEGKRQRLSNGTIPVSPKCNGDLNSKVRPTKSENGNGNAAAPPKQSSGSMAAVA